MYCWLSLCDIVTYDQQRNKRYWAGSNEIDRYEADSLSTDRADPTDPRVEIGSQVDVLARVGVASLATSLAMNL